MKKIVKIVKWTGLSILLIVCAICIAVPLRQHLKFDAPYPDIHASKDSAVIARGRHLVISAAHCVDCHGRGNQDSMMKLGKDVPLMGGFTFELPLGKVYAKNITPDMETGIGRRTDAELARVLRYGVHANGDAVFNFMPFQHTSDEDLRAIISYLRSTEPVKNRVPDHELNALGKSVRAFMVKPVGPTDPVPVSVKPDTTATYGKYLVFSVANCRGCHTQRQLTGEYTGPLLAGGNPMGEKDLALTPPNLTTDSSSRIFGWSKEKFMGRFREGKKIAFSHMPWESYNRMTDEELTAIYNYLITVPAAKIETPAKGK